MPWSTLPAFFRERGLTLQSSKTVIRSDEEVESRNPCPTTPALERIRSGYVNEVIGAGLMAADVSIPRILALDHLVGESEIDFGDSSPGILRVRRADGLSK